MSLCGPLNLSYLQHWDSWIYSSISLTKLGSVQPLLFFNNVSAFFSLYSSRTSIMNVFIHLVGLIWLFDSGHFLLSFFFLLFFSFLLSVSLDLYSSCLFQFSPFSTLLLNPYSKFLFSLLYFSAPDLWFSIISFLILIFIFKLINQHIVLDVEFSNS